MDHPAPAQERRHNRRVAVSYGAVVYYNTLVLPDCEVRDLSPEGAFVVTGGHFLPDRALVDLAIPQISTPGMPQRLNAQVVRSDGHGVGLRLVHRDASALRRFVEVFYALPA
jgi:hypothetical protein